MKRQKRLQGSYTIEASLLMGILLPLLAGIIFMGFYLHDRAFLQGAAYETAVSASLRIDDGEADADAVARKLSEGRMLGTRGLTADAAADKKQVQVNYEGSFSVPYMFFGMNKAPVRAAAALTLERPSRRIQKIRGVSKVVNAMRRKRE